MALPKVTIKYLNGLLGVAPESKDGLLALVLLGASAVGATFELGIPYLIYGFSSLATLGITEENNYRLVELVRQFYSEAEEGTPLYIVGEPMGYMNNFCDKHSGKLVQLVEQLKGEVRGVVLASTTDETPSDGIPQEVYDAIPAAQLAAEYCADSLYAPIFVLLEGRCLSSANDLLDFSEEDYDRVGVFVGSTSQGSMDTAIGLLAGRIASVPIQRNIGAVLSGSLKATKMYLATDLIDRNMDQVRTCHEKGYIVPRIHIGRSGYYIADDVMCCSPTKDYAHLTARRTIDKAARIAYDALLDFLLSEVELNDDGTMQQPVVKSWQAAVESAINGQMTVNGELSALDGSGCRCIIDASQNVLSTGKINVTLKVRPFGYAREIDCSLGFLTNKA